MQVQISGKSVDVGDALRAHITERLELNVNKYFDGTAEGHVTVMREGGDFRVECVVHLSSGIMLQSKGQSGDAYAGFDMAAERLEKRLRRYKRRLKDYHSRHNNKLNGLDAPNFVIATSDEEETEAEDLNPAIIAENTTRVEELTVGDAVMRIDVSEEPFLIFKNASHGGINVVYRRDDGNFGWIDPGVAGDN